MRNATSVCTAILVMLLGAAAARAERFESTDAAIGFELPDDYVITGKSDRAIAAQDPSGELEVLFVVVDGATSAKDVLARLDAEISAVATGAEWSKPKAVKHNGLGGFKLKGKARIGDKDVALGVLVLGPTRTKRGIVLVGATLDGKQSAHAAELAAILKSLKPTK